jgi:hypothetical protein
MQSVKAHINPTYSKLNSFIFGIPSLFPATGTPVHIGRNEVRIAEIDGIKLVIKYFKRITLANRFIYAHFRKSKAQRSYEYSEILRQKGFSSPEPVAYIDCHNKGVLTKSYYICLYTDYKPVKELLELPLEEAKVPLEAFARFTYKLHKSGIFHEDYSTSNVLYQFSNGNYDFALIDNNRIKFYKYGHLRSIGNLMRRQIIPVEYMGIIAAEYAKEANANGVEILNSMTAFKLLFMREGSIKAKLKRWKRISHVRL